jgi:hypothetical protein
MHFQFTISFILILMFFAGYLTLMFSKVENPKQLLMYSLMLQDVNFITKKGRDLRKERTSLMLKVYSWILLLPMVHKRKHTHIY